MHHSHDLMIMRKFTYVSCDMYEHACPLQLYMHSMCAYEKVLVHLTSRVPVLITLSLQSSNNMMVGIAQNDCSGNTITGNTVTSNHFEGITADNQANNAKVLSPTHP